MQPRKRAKLSNGTPGGASESGSSSPSKLPPVRAPHRPTPPSNINDNVSEYDSDSDKDEDEDGDSDDDSRASEQDGSADPNDPDVGVVGWSATASTSFVNASSGDAYLVAHSTTSKSSNNLISSYIDPAFTLSSYAAALREFDDLRRELDDSVEEVSYYDDDFHCWFRELKQGFNVVLYGFGSKRQVIDSFSKYVRRKGGHAIVVDGFDPLVSFTDVVSALEELLKVDDVLADTEKAPTTRAKGSRKSKKARAAVPMRKRVAVSPLETRVRRVCAALAQDEDAKDVYLLVHTLDGPALRAPRVLSLLALLCARPKFHLVASVDHIKAALIFPPSLALARPPSVPDPDFQYRAFTFLFHEVTTRAPFATEVAAEGILSRILPPSIFPRLSAITGHGGILTSSSSLSPVQSAMFVLKTVTTRSQNLFSLLASLQLAAAATVASARMRAADLDPPATSPAPPCAVGLDTLKTQAVDQLIALGDDQVDALLSEFKDHGVVKSSNVAPEGTDEESSSWVWIPLRMEDVEELIESEEGKEQEGE